MQSDRAKREISAEHVVTIVIAPRERFSYARVSLDSVYANTSLPFRLIYVDGGSPADIKRYIQTKAVEKGFRVIRTENYLSPNQARNIGLQYADTEYVVFLDNDVEVSPAWLSELVQCAEETNASLVGPLYCIGQPIHQVIHMAGGEAGIREEQGQRRFYEKHRFCDQHVSEVRAQLRREPCDLIEFHCMLVRREVFREIGPLDEALLSTREHVDLCLTVREAGRTIWFEPNAVVTHAPDSIWPGVPPPFSWTDIPFYLLRWSDEWGQSSLRHFEQKWDLDASSWQLTKDWLQPQRQIPFRKLRARFQRLVGSRLGDCLVDALERFLAMGARRKGHRRHLRGDNEEPLVSERLRVGSESFRAGARLQSMVNRGKE